MVGAENGAAGRVEEELGSESCPLVHISSI